MGALVLPPYYSKFRRKPEIVTQFRKNNISFDHSGAGNSNADTISSVSFTSGALVLVAAWASVSGNFTGAVQVGSVSCTGVPTFSRRVATNGVFQSTNSVTLAFEVWYGVAASTQSGQTVTVTWNHGTNANHVVEYASFLGVDPSNPFDCAASYHNIQTTGGSVTDTMTLTASDAKIWLVAAQFGSQNVPNTGFSAAVQQGGFSPNYSLGYNSSPTPGAQSFGITTGGAPWGTYMDALRPA